MRRTDILAQAQAIRAATQVLGRTAEDGVALTERDVAAGNVTVSAAWQNDYGGGFWDESGDYWP